MGVCRALVGNYLAVLAKGKRLRPPVVFQGATAQNVALVRCFEESLGMPIIVPENCSFMGAIGIAQLAAENMVDPTHYRGNAILNSRYRTSLTRCQDCENNCELLKLYCGKRLLTISGSRCGKWDKASSPR